jgi:queuine/archaeosine tRNA-ribosyltransferase
MKMKLMASLAMACELFVYHNLYVILTNLSFLVETIRDHRIDENVTVFRHGYGSCAYD